MEKQRTKRNKHKKRRNRRATYSIRLLLSPETKERLLTFKGVVE